MYHDNRQIFIDLGIRNDFNFPKDHFINHYHELIEIFGTMDNYDTSYTEHLHIDLAKDAYRATNLKDEYPQMTAWLDWWERVLLHKKFINRRIAKCLNSKSSPNSQSQAPWLPPLVKSEYVVILLLMALASLILKRCTVLQTLLGHLLSLL